MNHVTSKDGTKIAFDKLGSGPAVILVCGGSVDRQSNNTLAAELAKDFTVYNYDRRGRGDSGDAPPYAIEREVEDIEAIADEAGSSSFLYGISSGAALALHAAAKLPGKISRVAMYEPPYILEGGRPVPPPDTATIYHNLVAEGRRGDAVEYFMLKVVGLPEEFAEQARNSPWWPAGEALAHTLEYDATVMADYSLPTELAGSVEIPALVAAGGETGGWMRDTAEALAAALPHGTYRIIEGQTHEVAAEALGPVLANFFME